MNYNLVDLELSSLFPTLSLSQVYEPASFVLQLPLSAQMSF